MSFWTFTAINHQFSRWSHFRVYAVSYLSSSTVFGVGRSKWPSLGSWTQAWRFYHWGRFFFSSTQTKVKIDGFRHFYLQINGISVIRAGHRQAVELIRSTTGTLRLTASSVVAPKKGNFEWQAWYTAITTRNEVYDQVYYLFIRQALFKMLFNLS